MRPSWGLSSEQGRQTRGLGTCRRGESKGSPHQVPSQEKRRDAPALWLLGGSSHKDSLKTSAGQEDAELPSVLHGTFNCSPPTQVAARRPLTLPPLCRHETSL